MFTSNGVVQVLFIEMHKKFLNTYGTMFSYNSFSFIKNNLWTVLDTIFLSKDQSFGMNCNILMKSWMSTESHKKLYGE